MVISYLTPKHARIQKVCHVNFELNLWRSFGCHVNFELNIWRSFGRHVNFELNLWRSKQVTSIKESSCQTKQCRANLFTVS